MKKTYGAALQHEIEETEGHEGTPVEIAPYSSERHGYRVPGRTLTAYYPGSGQIALVRGSSHRSVPDADKLVAIIDFFVSVFDGEDVAYLRERLLTRPQVDPFGVREAGEIVVDLMEEWTGRPFPKSDGSTPSRKKGGKSSKPRSLESTSSDSQPTASST